MVKSCECGANVSGGSNKAEKWASAEIIKKVRNFLRKPLDKLSYL